MDIPNVDMHDYEKAQATIRLMNELEKGRVSGEKEGYYTVEEVEQNLMQKGFPGRKKKE